MVTLLYTFSDQQSCSGNRSRPKTRQISKLASHVTPRSEQLLIVLSYAALLLFVYNTPIVATLSVGVNSLTTGSSMAKDRNSTMVAAWRKNINGSTTNKIVA